MKKRIVSRRLLAVLLALSMCLSLLPVIALAEEETETAPGEEEALEFNEAAPSEEEPEISQPPEAVPEQIASDELDAAPSEIEPRSGETWEKVPWEDIQSGGTYLIAMTKSGDSWLLPNATASSTPLVNDTAKVEIADATTTIVADRESYGWTFESSGNGYAIINSESKYLYTTDSNSGVRVGGTQGIWTLNNEETYLSMPVGNNTRYLGISTAGQNGPDWRAYTNTTGNTAGQKVSFWHLQGETVAEHTKVYTPSATPGTNSTFVAWGGVTVTLNCRDTGVTYHTSTDNGSSWNELSGNTFTVPADTAGTYSIQVKATKVGLTESDVLSLSYTILSESDVKTIAQARAGSAGTSSNPGDTFVVSGVVTYVSGSNFYIQDETAGIVLYDNTLNLKRGQEVAVSGGLVDYNGLFELVKVSVLGTKAGTLPEAKEVAIADISDSVQAQLVKITGAKVVSVSGKTVTLSANNTDKTINITNCPAIENLSKDDTVTVTAVVSKNSGGNYLLVNSANDVEITDDVTPEKPDPGPVDPRRRAVQACQR